MAQERIISSTKYVQKQIGRLNNVDNSKLQFAIISDLWGGYREGVFDDAVNKINMLQPQFVMSVGDLIDGKTKDEAELARQWNEFNGVKDKLQAPFFYVAGNHDLSSKWMEGEWIRRYGSPYYHFIFKDVLFLVINTQDGGKSGISDDQVLYFKEALEKNTTVRWTFVFMHRPIWKPESLEKGYEKIEAFLSDRNYTVFSGHHHTYLNIRKNGNEHFVLGTTGGGIELRGEQFGEFDHITWVTLNEKEPIIANLKLTGIIQSDIVNEKNRSITQALMTGKWLIIPSDTIQASKVIKTKLVFNNDQTVPLKVYGVLSMNGIRVSPESVNETIAPGGIREIPIIFHQKGLNAETIPIKLTGEYRFGDQVYSLPVFKDIIIQRK